MIFHFLHDTIQIKNPLEVSILRFISFVILFFLKIFVCITDLTEQKAEVLERRLSVAPVIEGELPPLHRRSRASSILERSEPKSLSTVQSTMASERLSYIAMFEGVIGMTMAIVTMTIGKDATFNDISTGYIEN